MTQASKPTLPDVDIFDPAYIAESKRCDRCSCAPDMLDGVYFGMVCRRHDRDYRWITDHADRYSFWQRLKLKWAADQRLHDGIRDAFARTGQDGLRAEAVADAYRLIVRRCNWIFRIWKAVTLQSM